VYGDAITDSYKGGGSSINMSVGGVLGVGYDVTFAGGYDN